MVGSWSFSLLNKLVEFRKEICQRGRDILSIYQPAPYDAVPDRAVFSPSERLLLYPDLAKNGRDSRGPVGSHAVFGSRSIDDLLVS
jgi:hypothetical protein